MMKKKQRMQVMAVVVAGLVWLGSLWWSRKSEEISHSELGSLRESLAAEMEQSEIFDKGYVSLMVGWALLHHLGKSSVAELIDAVVEDKLPSLALFFAEDRRSYYDRLPAEVAKLEVTRNPENLKIWKLVQPKNCQDILPLYLNTKTGSFICGDASVATIELWRRGLPHLPFSLFSGPALALDPGAWTSKQWIKYVFQGVTR